MKKKIALLVGVGVSILCLWLILRKQDFAELAAVFGSLKWSWVALSVVVFYLSMHFRAVRWRLFYPPEHKVSTRGVLGPMYLGYTLNSIFPARAGEFARAILVGRREKVPIATSFATVASERAIDSLTVLVALLLVFAFVPFGDKTFTMRVMGGDVTLSATTLKELCRQKLVPISCVLLAGILLLMVKAFRNLVLSVMDKMTFLPKKLVDFGKHVIESFALGFESLKSPRLMFWIVIHSALIWGLCALSVRLIGPAIGIQTSFMQALAIVMIVCVAIIIPATPGYWGPYELGFIFSGIVLGLKGPDGNAASIEALTAMALLVHLIQYLPIIAIGFGWALLSHTSMTEAARAAKEALKPEGGSD
jgi:uncharacterized protein (TIRG00374 family)